MDNKDILDKIRSEILSDKATFTYNNQDYKKGFETACDWILEYIERLYESI